ncbi:MAG TPA: hypothetical protein VM364_04710 [Vicinamibacterales bacterium]|nr:hypothetical protein [Vicinamibacterales bacterium]
MDAAQIALAVWLSTAGATPVVDTATATTTFTLREAAARASLSDVADRASAPAPRVPPRQQGARVSRFSKTERIIAVAAGASLGWFIGAAIGWKATETNDDVTGLRGVVIGAPVGAAVGAFIGYKLTK